MQKLAGAVGQFKEGFTLVELSLSIAFIAVLSIIMVLIITNSISAYHRGITLNSVNTVGMDLVDNMREAVQGSSGQSVTGECMMVYADSSVTSLNADGSAGSLDKSLDKCQDAKGASFVSVVRRAKVKTLDGEPFEAPVYGAFCTGDYSYIWNSGYFFKPDEYKVSADHAKFTYRIGESATKNTFKNGALFKLMRVEDRHRSVCKVAAGAVEGEYRTSEQLENSLSSNFDLTACDSLSAESKPVEICDVITNEPIDILETSENNLALYDLEVATAADNGNVDSMFYTASFILGTVQGGINIVSTNNYCATPEGYNFAVENFEYCAINKFNFAAQATGGKK